MIKINLLLFIRGCIHTSDILISLNLNLNKTLDSIHYPYASKTPKFGKIINYYLYAICDVKEEREKMENATEPGQKKENENYITIPNSK